MKQKLFGLLTSLVLVVAGVVVMAPPAAADSGGTGAAYVALGDSFSAGTGVPPYSDSACLRSESSGYPTLLARSRAFRGLDNRTCSGAGAADVSALVAAGIADLGPATRSVTLTVGGNDIGWSTALATCMGSPQACSAVLAQVVAMLPAVKASIAQLVQDIAVKAPNADIYVTGYPYIFGDFRETCTVGTAPNGVPIVVDRETATTVNAAVVALNIAIAKGVKKSGERDAVHVDAALFSLRHGLCGSSSDWINGVQFNGAFPLPQSLHPNAAGEKSYAGRVLVASWLK